MIVIVDSGGANLNSIIFALSRLNVSAKLTTKSKEIKSASHVILPGVGTAKKAMQLLSELNLCETMRSLTQPVLGICLGMQLLYERSTEGNVDCLNIINGHIEKLPVKKNIIVPHMGWNKISIIKEVSLLKGIENNSYFYFVHSYVAPINNTTCAITTHGTAFTAICKQNNFRGTQFHPERSGDIGSKILKKFSGVIKMQIYPAIDLYNGKCVRLYQGEFNQQTIYDDPVTVAKSYLQEGANWLHVIDLDAAKDNRKNQLPLVKEIIISTSLNIQYGGGVRTAKQIENLLNLKISRIILGSMAVKEPKLIADWLLNFGSEKIVLALDIRSKNNEHYIAIEGWQKITGVKLFDLLNYYANVGLTHLLCTDIARDGTLNGPNIKLYAKIMQKFPNLQLQASGGVSTLKDIKKLKNINVPGVIIGRALYEKKINLSEALIC